MRINTNLLKVKLQACNIIGTNTGQTCIRRMLKKITATVTDHRKVRCKRTRNNRTSSEAYYARLMALFPGLPGWAGTRKVKPIWILLKQETVSGCGISWAVCKSVPHSRQITTPAPHHSVFYGPDALPATQPTASKHSWWFMAWNR